MREVASTIAVRSPSRRSASEIKLHEAQPKLADTLLRTQGKNIVQLFHRLINDPFDGEGDWDSISSEHPEEISFLQKAFTVFEEKIEEYHARKAPPDPKLIKSCANTVLILCDAVAEFFQKALKECAEQIEPITESGSLFEREIQSSFASVGTIEDDDEDADDRILERSNSSPFPKGVTVEDFEASLRGAQSFIKNFAFTLLHLTGEEEGTTGQFELRTLISRTLSPDFMGHVDVPSNRVLLNVKQDSVRDISILAQGILNTTASAIEDDLTMQATSQRMSGRGPDSDVNTQLSELLLERILEVKTNGEVIFTLSGIPLKYFPGEVKDAFNLSFDALEEVYRARKEFILESDENPNQGTLSIKFNRGGILSTLHADNPGEIDLSGLKAVTVRTEEPEEGTVYLPWYRPLGGTKVLVNAPATFWNNRATSNLIGRVCSAADLIYQTSKPLVDISIRAVNDTSLEDFLKGKFLFSLLGKTIAYNHDARTLHSPVAPRFMPGASYFTFPAHIINSPSIMESSNTILRKAKGFCVSLANADFMPPNTLTAKARCEEVLAMAAKLLEGKKDNYLRIKILPASDSTSCRFAIQLFSSDGREQERYYFLEDGAVKQIALNPAIQDEAVRNMLRALKQRDEYATAHDVLIEFTKCRIDLTNTFAEGLLGVARSSDDPDVLKSFLVEYLLDPLTLIQQDERESSKPFFKVGRSGETAFYTEPRFLE